MDRRISVGRAAARTRLPGSPALGLALGVLAVALLAGAGTDGEAAAPASFDFESVARPARRLARAAAGWYARTPPADRVTWGGLAAAAGLGLGAALERAARLRRRRILPAEFNARFLGRLTDGKLDRGKALDYCELNPSPASRVALAAVRRWGRSASDLERAVAIAHRVEADRLRRNIGTLRRVAALAPLIGLLGTLLDVGRALESLGTGTATAGAWGPAMAAALTPLTAGVAVAVLALVAYDGLAGRADALAGALERVGAYTIDAIAMIVHPDTPSGSVRTPHQLRIDVPRPDDDDKDGVRYTRGHGSMAED
jgi:biopolymer transport protein ExbB